MHIFIQVREKEGEAKKEIKRERENVLVCAGVYCNTISIIGISAMHSPLLSEGGLCSPNMYYIENVLNYLHP